MSSIDTADIPATVSPPSPTDPAIQALWLRDAVAAYNSVTRPTVILAAGLSVSWAAFVEPKMFEIVGIAAGLAGGVGFLRSLDKKTENK